ncbi:helix-turn-helix domain-containing protein [Paenibacillus oceani]|uniref:Helix-turn-helix transcriptional regulator n=1 Tax=Paenibacillus oceani TaxID=2772510 RepID=A0A927C6W3_9BACL|nr:AraC family transcriptional regulator [Paenibacillus oceani]MBD2862320.1 helix-turn-helix transcriptional regulator [Paenibacillus oceani]
MNELKLQLCGYSYHTQPAKYLDHQDGLPHYLFRLQMEGYCQAMVDGALTTIRPGDLLLYMPGDRYELVIGAQKSELGETALLNADYFLSCTGDWVDEWWRRTAKSQKTKIHSSDKLVSLWRHLVLEKRRFRMGADNLELLGYLLRALCLCIDQALLETTAPHGRSFAAVRMKTFIEENALFAFKVEHVARHVSLSVSRSIHLFKECFGLSIMEYAKEVRLAAAIERIKYSTLPLEQIAEASGFASYSFFYRAFRQKYGLSPLEYRKQEWDRAGIYQK